MSGYLFSYVQTIGGVLDFGWEFLEISPIESTDDYDSALAELHKRIGNPRLTVTAWDRLDYVEGSGPFAYIITYWSVDEDGHAGLNSYPYGHTIPLSHPSALRSAEDSLRRRGGFTRVSIMSCKWVPVVGKKFIADFDRGMLDDRGDI